MPLTWKIRGTKQKLMATNQLTIAQFAHSIQSVNFSKSYSLHYLCALCDGHKYLYMEDECLSEFKRNSNVRFYFYDALFHNQDLVFLLFWQSNLMKYDFNFNFDLCRLYKLVESYRMAQHQDHQLNKLWMNSVFPVSIYFMTQQNMAYNIIFKIEYIHLIQVKILDDTVGTLNKFIWQY